MNNFPELNVKLGYPTVTKDLSLGSNDIQVTRLKSIFNALSYEGIGPDLKSKYSQELVDKVKEFQKENHLDQTGIVDPKTRNAINNSFFWYEYREYGATLLNTPEWNRIKKLPTNLIVKQTECGYDSKGKIDTGMQIGQPGSCLLAFSVKNNSAYPLTLETFVVKASKFTDTSKLKAFLISANPLTVSENFYFSADSIKNNSVILKKNNKKDTTILPGQIIPLELTTGSILSAKGKIQFSLSSIATTFGKIKKLNTYPVGPIKEYVPIISYDNVGTYTASSSNHIFEERKYILLENRQLIPGQTSLMGMFRIDHNKDTNLHVQRLRFKVIVNPVVPLKDYVALFKTTPDGYFDPEPPRLESEDTFSVAENTFMSSGSTSFNIYLKPPSSLGTITLELIGVDSEEKESPTNLPVMGPLQIVTP
jgi:peptidoglycan hydrolase-like protein with peptidoglycan-binding domain